MGDLEGANSYTVARIYLPFDTSALNDATTINSATLVVNQVDTAGEGTRGVGLIQTTQASNTSLAVGDFDALTVNSPTEGATRVTCDSTGDKTWTLNASGLSWIVKTGYTKLGLRMDKDIDNSTPTARNYSRFSFAEATGTADDPVLSIDHTDPVSGPANLKTYNTNATANIKSINTNLIANVKSLNTNT